MYKKILHENKYMREQHKTIFIKQKMNEQKSMKRDMYLVQYGSTPTMTTSNSPQMMLE